MKAPLMQFEICVRENSLSRKIPIQKMRQTNRAISFSTVPRSREWHSFGSLGLVEPSNSPLFSMLLEILMRGTGIALDL
jgi:hypothetical protein